MKEEMRRVRRMMWRAKAITALRLFKLRIRMHLLRLRKSIRLALAREKQTCPRRMGEWGPWESKEQLDYWRKVGPDRTCSFCGSLHPQDFMRFLVRVINDGDDVRLERSDKRYKFYLHRPEVKNAKQGAIKFYTHHLRQLSADEMSRLEEVYGKAYGVSREKWRRYHEAQRERVLARLKETGHAGSHSYPHLVTNENATQDG